MDPVLIQDYDPLWLEQFLALRSRLTTLLGDLAAAVEHVGSTAVPGLAAKPTIDIDVLLRSASDLPTAIASLASFGYEHRGDLGIAGREAFRRRLGDLPHHLYVCPPGSSEYQRHIAFRDHLRARPDSARAYATLKRELAARFRNDREAYNQAKTKFVEGILNGCAEIARHGN